MTSYKSFASSEAYLLYLYNEALAYLSHNVPCPTKRFCNSINSKYKADPRTQLGHKYLGGDA